MQKPVIGQYEYVHSSGVGLDYFTSRIDRLTLQPRGRFALISQDSSRLANAAQSFLANQQVATNAPETRKEGYYSSQGNTLVLNFDDGTQQQGQFSWNGDGVQLGQNFFNKVSDSTVLPPTHRIKKDMEDIAKGIKIAGTIGSTVFKAAKTIHETIQSTQTPNAATQGGVQPMQPTQPTQPTPPAQPMQSAQPVQPVRPAPPIQQTAAAQPVQQNQNAPQEALFCDQCGARIRPGKHFCNNCGSRLP